MYFKTLSNVRSFLSSQLGDNLAMNLISPVTVTSPEGKEVQVTYIARNSKEGRIRLFETERSRPMELSHCSGVLSAFTDYSRVVAEKEKIDTNKSLLSELVSFRGLSAVSTFEWCHFKPSDREMKLAHELDAIINGTTSVDPVTASSGWLRDLLDLAKRTVRNNEFHDKFEFVLPSDISKFNTRERAQYWWYRASQEGTDFNWRMRDIWSDSHQFGEDVPVFQDVWVKSYDLMQEISKSLHSAGYKTIKFVDHSSASLNHLIMLTKLGWRVKETTSVRYTRDEERGYDGLLLTWEPTMYC